MHTQSHAARVSRPAEDACNQNVFFEMTGTTTRPPWCGLRRAGRGDTLALMRGGGALLAVVVAAAASRARAAARLPRHDACVPGMVGT
jgi:hypothetical protein